MIAITVAIIGSILLAYNVGWFLARSVYRPKAHRDGYGWTCHCGASGYGFATMDEAMADLECHDVTRHPHFDPEGDLLAGLFGAPAGAERIEPQVADRRIEPDRTVR